MHHPSLQILGSTVFSVSAWLVSATWACAQGYLLHVDANDLGFGEYPNVWPVFSWIFSSLAPITSPPLALQRDLRDLMMPMVKKSRLAQGDCKLHNRRWTTRISPPWKLFCSWLHECTGVYLLTTEQANSARGTVAKQMGVYLWWMWTLWERLCSVLLPLLARPGIKGATRQCAG